MSPHQKKYLRQGYITPSHIRSTWKDLKVRTPPRSQPPHGMKAVGYLYNDHIKPSSRKKEKIRAGKHENAVISHLGMAAHIQPGIARHDSENISANPHNSSKRTSSIANSFKDRLRDIKADTDQRSLKDTTTIINSRGKKAETEQTTPEMTTDFLKKAHDTSYTSPNTAETCSSQSTPTPEGVSKSALRSLAGVRSSQQRASDHQTGPVIKGNPTTNTLQTTETIVSQINNNNARRKSSRSFYTIPADATIVQPPAVSGSPPSPPWRRFETKNGDTEREVARQRIAEIYGQEFAKKKLLIQPIQTFSSKDYEQSDEDDTESNIENQARENPIVKEQKGKKMGDKKAKAKRPEGWDAVLAVAAQQARRLQERDARKARDALYRSTPSHDDAKRLKPGKTKDRNMQKDQIETPNTSAYTPIEDQQASHKKTKSNKRKRDSQNAESNEDACADPNGTSSQDDTKRKRKLKSKTCTEPDNVFSAHSLNNTPISDLQKTHTNQEGTERGPPTRQDLEETLRTLMPFQTLENALRTLNNEERTQFSTMLAKKKDKHHRRILKGKKERSSDVASMSVKDFDNAVRMADGGDIDFGFGVFRKFAQEDSEVLLRAACDLLGMSSRMQEE